MAKTISLYELPKGAKIYGLRPNDCKNGLVIFDHPDGMYSYCQAFKDKNGNLEANSDNLNFLGVVHLKVTMPLVEYEDGYKLSEDT